MKHRIHAIATVAAIATAGMLMSAMPAEAGQRTVYLPGVKGYNFKASPSKIRRLCVNYWKGRYWRQKPFYGCDGIKFRWRHWRVTCGPLTTNCIISMRSEAMGPDGGRNAPREPHGNYGGSTSRP